MLDCDVNLYWQKTGSHVTECDGRINGCYALNMGGTGFVS